MSSPKKMRKKKNNKKDKNFLESFHMFDRDSVNGKALMFIKIFKSMFKSNITVADLCLGLYPNNIKIENFFKIYIKQLNDPDLTADQINMQLSLWLEENYIVFWLLTCDAVDDLLYENKIKWTDEGYLKLINDKD